MLNEAVPLAVLSTPNTAEYCPVALVKLPNAVEPLPLANALSPALNDITPMLSAFHCESETNPALNAAFPGSHIIRVPGPLTGVAEYPGVYAPENKTLLSATCNRACGSLVPMPTFCALAENEPAIIMAKSKFLFMAKVLTKLFAHGTLA